MKKILIALLALVSLASAQAQCDKKQIITASQTEYLDASGSVQRTVDEQTVIEYDKKQITITRVLNNQVMSGTIKSDTCNWTTAYKEGKSVIKALVIERGEERNFTITIEGKDGKILFLVEAQERPDRKIRIVIDKFEEKKG